MSVVDMVGDRVRCPGRRALGALLPMLLFFFSSFPLHAQTARTFLPDTLVLEGTVGESAGTILYEPTNLTATPDGRLVLFDFGTGSVREFATDGEELWHFGRKGQGPGEFAGATDVDVAPNGDIMVLDPLNRRITRLDSSGRLLEMTRVPRGAAPSCLLPPPKDGRLILCGVGKTLSQVISPKGRAERSQPLPEGVAFSSRLAGEAHSAFLDSGAVVVYRWAGVMVLVNADGSVRRVVDGVEPIPFPEVPARPMKIPGLGNAVVRKVDPDAPGGARWVSARDHRIFVLFRGRSEHAGRVVDIYDAAAGRYLGSELLPLRPTSFAALPGSRLATLEADSIPLIRVWKIQSKR